MPVTGVRRHVTSFRDARDMGLPSCSHLGLVPFLIQDIEFVLGFSEKTQKAVSYWTGA